MELKDNSLKNYILESVFSEISVKVSRHGTENNKFVARNWLGPLLPFISNLKFTYPFLKIILPSPLHL